MFSSKKMDSTCRVQMLDEADCSSFHVVLIAGSAYIKISLSLSLPFLSTCLPVCHIGRLTYLSLPIFLSCLSVCLSLFSFGLSVSMTYWDRKLSLSPYTVLKQISFSLSLSLSLLFVCLFLTYWNRNSVPMLHWEKISLTLFCLSASLSLSLSLYIYIYIYIYIYKFHELNIYTKCIR